MAAFVRCGIIFLVCEMKKSQNNPKHSRDGNKAHVNILPTICHFRREHCLQRQLKKMKPLRASVKRNGGAFSEYSVVRTIDGRADVKAHGDRHMPV